MGVLCVTGKDAQRAESDEDGSARLYLAKIFEAGECLLKIGRTECEDVNASEVIFRDL